jgi:hypothetical protein
LGHDEDAVDHKSDAQYTKDNTEGQGHVLEEKAGDANAGNICAKRAIDFGNELLGFFVECDFHDNSFRLNPLAKGSWGKLRRM